MSSEQVQFSLASIAPDLSSRVTASDYQIPSTTGLSKVELEVPGIASLTQESWLTGWECSLFSHSVISCCPPAACFSLKVSVHLVSLPGAHAVSSACCWHPCFLWPAPFLVDPSFPRSWLAKTSCNGFCLVGNFSERWFYLSVWFLEMCFLVGRHSDLFRLTGLIPCSL